MGLLAPTLHIPDFSLSLFVNDDYFYYYYYHYYYYYYYYYYYSFLAYYASKELADDYEWQWRLDDDSLISEDVGYDVFHLMAMNKKRYGYTNIVQDDDKCVIGLWDAAKKYIDQNKLDTTFFSR